MSGHLDGPPPGPPDPPYIPGDLGAPSAEEFARRRASPTPEERNPYAPSADWKPGQDTFTSQAAGIWAEGFAAGRAAATPDTRSKIHGTGNVPAPDRWLALDRRSGRVAGLPTVEVVAAEDYDREVNDLRDQVQMYEEKAERDWRDFGEMQDARIAADDRVVELEKELARVCKQLDSANDMVERARSLAHRSRCEGYDEARAASPDERLREADRAVILEWAKFTRDESAGYWGRREEDVYQRLLAAADRPAASPDPPDEEATDG